MPQPTTLRYYADFISRRGRHWHIEILQDHTRGNLHKVYPQELSLPAYEPLVIEWDEAARHDPLRPSRATLTAESPTDRTFLHLFQAPAGSVLLNVYYHTTPHSTQPILYWQGYLDPELYEEPYTRASGYDVMLTFTDLGILSRMNPRIWNRAYTPIRSLIRSIISRAGLQNSTGTAMCVSYINNNNNTVTHVNTDGGPVFHDYDTSRPGSALSYLQTDKLLINPLRHISEGTDLYTLLAHLAQPYGNIIFQHMGKIHCINPAYFNLMKLPPVTLRWDSTDAMLSTDRTYHSCKATFKPGAPDSLIPQPQFPDVAQSDYLTAFILQGLSAAYIPCDHPKYFDPCGMTFATSGTGGNGSGIIKLVPRAKTNTGYESDTTYPAIGSALTGWYRHEHSFGPICHTDRLHIQKGTGQNLYILSFDYLWRGVDGFSMIINRYADYYSEFPTHYLTFEDKRVPKWITWQTGSKPVNFVNNVYWDITYGGYYTIDHPDDWTDTPGNTLHRRHYTLVFPIPEGCHIQINLNAGGTEPDGISHQWQIISGLTLQEYEATDMPGLNLKNEVTFTQTINHQAEETIEQDFIYGSTRHGASRTAYGHILRPTDRTPLNNAPTAWQPQPYWCNLMKTEYSQRAEVLSGTIHLDPTAALLYHEPAMGTGITFQKVASRQDIIQETDEVRLVRQYTTQKEYKQYTFP